MSIPEPPSGGGWWPPDAPPPATPPGPPSGPWGPGWPAAPHAGAPGPYPGSPAGLAPPTTSGAAIAALVLGLIGLVSCPAFLFGIVAIVLGVIGIRRIDASAGRVQGRGLALSGVVAGVVSLLAGVAFWVLWSSDGFQEGFQDALETSGGFGHIQVGDCVDVPEEENIFGLDEVSCQEPHEAEVYLVGELEAGPFPGAARSEEQSRFACLAAFESFVGAPYDESRFDAYYVYPEKESWARDDRGYICMVVDIAGNPLAPGTVKGSGE